jgi:hypothetical protein
MGTEAFWVPAVLAAASAGGQYVNQKQAANRQDTAEAQSIRDQQDIQQKAAGEVNSLTKQIAQNSPNQIQGKATGDYVNQLRTAAASADSNKSPTFGASTSGLAPVAGASGRYNADVGKSQQQVQDYGNTTAGEMGAMDAAVRQRQNEGLAQQTLGTNLNTLGAQSYTKSFVDQLRAQAAGVQNPWVTLGTGMLGAGAKGYSGAGAAGSGLVSTGAAASGVNSTGAYNDLLNSIYKVQ